MARSLEKLQKEYNSTAAASHRGPMAATNNFKGKPANMRGTLKRIFSYVGVYKKRLALVLLCMVLSTGASLAGSYLLRPIINRIADDGTQAVEAQAEAAEAEAGADAPERRSRGMPKARRPISAMSAARSAKASDGQNANVWNWRAFGSALGVRPTPRMKPGRDGSSARLSETDVVAWAELW